MSAIAPSTLGSQLRLAVLRLSRRLRQQTAGQITASQISALATVAKRGELTLGELAGIEQVAPPSMTRIAARLEEQGLVERRADAADRRVARVALSPEGERLLDGIRTRRDAYLAERLAGFTPEEQAVLQRAIPLLERLASHDEA
jgi:DNA-binding MarR family transcriptional regulator